MIMPDGIAWTDVTGERRQRGEELVWATERRAKSGDKLLVSISTVRNSRLEAYQHAGVHQ